MLLILWAAVLCGAPARAAGAEVPSAADRPADLPAPQPAGPLRIAVERDNPPFSVIAPDGFPAGLLVDLWRLWGEVNDTPVAFVEATLAEGQAAVQAGAADLHAGLFADDELRRWGLLSEPVHEVASAVFFRDDGHPPPLLQDMTGSRIGAVTGSFQKHFVEKTHFQLDVVGYDDTLAMVTALLKGQVRAVVGGGPSVEAALGRLGLRGGLVRSDEVLFPPRFLHAVVRRDRPDLLRRVNDGLAALPPPRLAALERRWLPNLAERFYAGGSGNVEFTDAEQTWLATNPVVRLGVAPPFPPYDVLDADGTYTGFNAELMALLSREIGTDVVPEFFADWNALYEAGMAGKVDGMISIAQTPERRKALKFTQPYAFDSVIVLTRGGRTDIRAWDDLAGKRLSARRNKGSSAEVRRLAGDGNFVEVDSDAEALRLLREGAIDAHVTYKVSYAQTLATTPIEPQGGLALAVDDEPRVAVVHNSERGKLRIGIHRTRPELYSIMRKALNAIPAADMRRIRTRWLFPVVPTAASAVEIGLNAMEKAWIKTHPTVTIGVEGNWPPIDFMDPAGRHAGIAAAFLDLIGKRVGLTFTAVAGPQFKDMLARVRRGDLKAGASITPTEERARDLLFSDPFVQVRKVIVTRQGGAVMDSPDDLNGRTVAVERGYAVIDVLRRMHPDVRIAEYDNTIQALRAVSFGKADAYVGGHMVADWIMRSEQITNLAFAADAGLPRAPQTFAVHREPEWAPLVGILNKALASITGEEREAIMRRWVDIARSQEDQRVDLTPDERAWLDAHGAGIRVGVAPAWPPFEYRSDDGAFLGIGADYLDLVGSRLGLPLKPETERTWPQVVAAIKKQEVDLLPFAAVEPALAPFVNFTKPFSSLPLVVFNRDDTPFLGAIEDLAGRTIAVVEDHVAENLMRRDFPQWPLVHMPTVEDALRAVSAGQIDAFVGYLASGSHVIGALNITNVKVAAPTPYSVPIAMAVRKDWPRMVPILQKALDSITPEMARRVSRKWVSIRFDHGLDMARVLRVAVPVLAGLLLLVFVVVFWNRRLGHEIAKRRQAQEQLSLAHARLTDAHGQISDSIEYASRIQRSVLPSDRTLAEYLNEHFVLWEPRDVVGGDIYWCRRWHGGLLVILGDCTGHGVPGAFMTLISDGALDQAMAEAPAGDLGELVRLMHQGVQMTLNQHQAGKTSGDGLELGACFLDGAGALHFVGARFDLYEATGGTVRQIRGAKRGLGYRGIPLHQTYPTVSVALRPGQTFYMTSDGLIDQVGGERLRSFGKRRFMRLLREIHVRSLDAQREAIHLALTQFQGEERRRDDVSVIGFRSPDAAGSGA
ncbi:MAG: transporter substrate-binding domain-containing protein [Hyphomicrobiales bacterium]|nr:transporter substrate-binding domain-containing protein [Hyphomicrobiales bacterium]